jgi:hypothetical protein
MPVASLATQPVAEPVVYNYFEYCRNEYWRDLNTVTIVSQYACHATMPVSLQP